MELDLDSSSFIFLDIALTILMSRLP